MTQLISRPRTVRLAPRSQQTGVLALVVAVVVLIAATLLTLYTASPVRTEQQITGNELRAHQALNAAEAGLDFVRAVIRDYDPDFALCAGTAEDGSASYALADNSGHFQIVSIGGESCNDYWPPFDEDYVAAVGYISVNVVVEGRSDDRIAMRRLGQTLFLMDFGEGGGGNMAPLNFAGNTTFEAPNSNSFLVDGAGGPAISVQDAVSRQSVLEAIADVGRSDNYIGGVSDGGFGEPWDDPALLSQFVDAIKNGPVDRNFSGSQEIGGNTQWTGVSIVQGDMEFKGNSGGSGVLVVEGNLTTAGTPAFKGLIIVLGGQYTVTGGGAGGLDGSVFVANLGSENGVPLYNDTVFNSDGGGNADFNYSFDDLTNARNLLSSEAQALWELTDPSEEDDGLYGTGLQSGLISGSWTDF